MKPFTFKKYYRGKPYLATWLGDAVDVSPFPMTRPGATKYAKALERSNPTTSSQNRGGVTGFESIGSILTWYRFPFERSAK